jgi:hypothetical protein
VIRYQQGHTAEQIRESFPSLTLADVYSVITYYRTRREEVDDYLRRQEAKAEQVRQDIEARKPEVFELETRLRDRATEPCFFSPMKTLDASF